MRDKSLDILRGIGMIFVVMGHCGFPFTDFIYTFHVPLFFLLSGYLYKYNPNTDIFFVIRKKFIRLYVPLVLMLIFLILTHNCFINIGILCTDESLGDISKSGFVPVNVLDGFKDKMIEVGKALFMMGGGQLSGALWFLRTMLISSILLELQFRFINRFVKSENISFYVIILNIILFYIGVILSKYQIHIPYSLELVATTMIFYCIGIQSRVILKKILKLSSFFLNSIILVCFGSLLFITPFDVVDIARNKFSNPLLLLFGAVIGSFATYLLAVKLSKAKFANLLVYIGNNTICIMCWHFLAFKIVNFLLVLIYGYPHIYLAKFPVIDDRFWLIYTIVGIATPLMLGYFYNVVRDRLWNLLKQ